MSELTFTIDHPEFPDDHEFDIGHVFVAQNRTAVDVDEETQQRFVDGHGMTLREAYETVPMVTIKGRSASTEDNPNAPFAPNDGDAEQAEAVESDEGGDSA